MKNKEVELLWRYFINNLTALEQEVQQLQQNLRYRRIDTIDCHELALAIERLNTFQKVSNDILLLLRMDKDISEKFDKFEDSLFKENL
nr:MAG TPA: hypothetical protein [Inoviridae sp.]